MGTRQIGGSMRKKLPKPTGLPSNEAAVLCSKCDGTGFYCMGTRNGVPYSKTGFDCYTCGATGWKILSAAYVKGLETRAANEAKKAKAEADAIDADIKLREIPLNDLVVTAVWDIQEHPSMHTVSGSEFIGECLILQDDIYVDEAPPSGVRSAANNQELRWACQIVHEPTGKHYWVGRAYIRKIESLQASQFAVDSACQKLVEKMQRRANIATLVEQYGPEIEQAFTYAKEQWSPALLKDLASTGIGTGRLSEKQAALALRIWREDITRREQAGSVKAPLGQQTVTGKILSVKVKSGRFGQTLKMVVDLGNGIKVWGTAPMPLDDRNEGDEVTFSANFTQSDRDPLFGFYNRPRLKK